MMKTNICSLKLGFSKIKRLYEKRFFVFVAVFIAMVFGLAFTEIANEVWIERESFPFDKAVSDWFVEIQTPLGRFIFSKLTILGNTETIIFILILALGFLLYQRRFFEGVILLGGLFTTSFSVFMIKYLSDRPRPDSAFSVMENTMAFPSGHMGHALFLYGFFAYLLSRRMHNKTHGLLIICAAIGLSGIIGASRLYLNVHWLSDVLGGFTLSAAYLCLCIGFLELPQKNKDVRMS